MMKLYTLPSGDEVHRYKKSIVVPFKGQRRVLSTCPLGGGYQERLSAVFNNDGNPGAGIACTMKADTYEGHMAIIAKELGLSPDSTAGMSTAASMENVSIQSESYDNLTVTAVVTGGIEVNGGRVGDPASWHEVNGKSIPVTLGTINIMLFISTDLSEGALARAVVTCTEAKTAAIQELLAPSRYSMGLATGSGTDSTIVVCNSESQTRLTNAGKHCKLGELIGRAVMRAVKEALHKQSGLCPAHQHNLLNRVDRFGVTEDTLFACYGDRGGNLSRAEFADKLYHFAVSGRAVAWASLYAHLIDQLSWGLLSGEEAVTAGRTALAVLKASHDCPDAPVNTEREPAIRQMIDELMAAIIDCLLA